MPINCSNYYLERDQLPYYVSFHKLREAKKLDKTRKVRLESDVKNHKQSTPHDI